MRVGDCPDPEPNDPPILAALRREREDARRAELAAPSAGGGAHHWFSPSDNHTEEEVAVAKHGDDDLDGIVNQADPDWSGPDERDEHAVDDDECDQPQDRPDRWTGVTRDPDLLPVDGTDENGGPLDG